MQQGRIVTFTPVGEAAKRFPRINDLEDYLIPYAKEIEMYLKDTYKDLQEVGFDWSLDYDDFKRVLDAVNNTYYRYTGMIYFSYSAFSKPNFKIMPYYSIKTLKEDKAVEAEVKRVISELMYEGITEAKAVEILFNYVHSSIKYTENSTGVYNGIVAKKSNCAGYAYAFQTYCNYIGIECEYISGKAGGGFHAWNRVKVDGKWYYIDATWNRYMSETLWQTHALKGE